MISQRPLRSLKVIELLAILILAGCGSEPPVPEPERLVAVEKFQLRDHRVAVSYPGTLEPRYENELAFQVSGRIDRRLVEVGDRVEANTIIATLDRQDYDLALAELQNLKAAADADHQLAVRELKRIRELHRDGFAGDSQLDAAINLESASAARLKALAAKQSESRNRVGYTELKAQHGGIITALFAETGAVLAAGQPVAQLAWLGEWEFVTSIPENRIGKLAPGDIVDLRFWVLEDQTIHGQVREIAPAADPASRSYRVKISLESVPPALRLGMSGNVQLVFDQDSFGTLPTSAFLGATEQYDESGGRFGSDPGSGSGTGGTVDILVVDPDSRVTSLRQVTPGRPIGDRLVIVDGLHPGEWVVTKGAHKVKPGTRVRLFEGQ